MSNATTSASGPGAGASFRNCSQATGIFVVCLRSTPSDVDDDVYSLNWSPPEVTSPSTGSSANPFPVWHVALFGFLACCIGVVTVGGNLIVILSFILERGIRQPTNYFIASLAVSDLLIGSVSMPFYTTYLLSGQRWHLGEALCDLWLSIDYTACLCSIYTVFCITADRFCSVKLPAKYRKWRTGRKVVVIVCLTWIIPMVMFFTSIFGWQHFVGRRTVPTGRCYVQYMEDALFNCFLQIGYFWITLTAMFVLYAGIYRVALDLHRRSTAQREKTMSCLVSMAGRTVTQIGSVISISRTPCRIDGFALRADADPKLGGHARLGTIDEKRWEAGASQLGQNQDGEKLESFRPSDVPFFPFFCTNNEGGHSELNRKNETGSAVDRNGAKGQPVLDSFAKLNQSLERIKDLEPEPNSANRDISCHKDPLPSIAPITSTSAQEQRTVSAEPETATHDCPVSNNVAMTTMGDDVQVAMATRNGVAVEETTNDQLSVDSDAHELVVLLPNPRGAAAEAGICPKRLNRFRLTGGAKKLNPFASPPAPPASAADNPSPTVRSQLPVEQCITGSQLRPIIEIELAAKRGDADSRAKQCAGSAEKHPPKAPLKRDDSSCSSGRDDDDDSDDNRGGAHAHCTVSSERSCTPRYPLQQQQPQQFHHLQPVAKLIRHGLRSRHSSESRSAQLQQQRHDNKTRKALRTITLILGAFVICWIPWHVLSMIIGFCHDRNACVKPILYDISYWLCYLNSPINPFCYAFANQQFKKTFIRIIKLDWRRNN